MLSPSQQIVGRQSAYTVEVGGSGRLSDVLNPHAATSTGFIVAAMATITNAAVKTIRGPFNESSERTRFPTSVQRQYAREGEPETFYQYVLRFAKESDDGDAYIMGSILNVWNAGQPRSGRSRRAAAPDYSDRCTRCHAGCFVALTV